MNSFFLRLISDFKKNKRESLMRNTNLGYEIKFINPNGTTDLTKSYLISPSQWYIKNRGEKSYHHSVDNNQKSFTVMFGQNYDPEMGIRLQLTEVVYVKIYYSNDEKGHEINLNFRLDTPKFEDINMLFSPQIRFKSNLIKRYLGILSL
jgi:hypothetical protein